MAGPRPTPMPAIPRAAMGDLTEDLRQTLERLVRVMRAGLSL